MYTEYQKKIGKSDFLTFAKSIGDLIGDCIGWVPWVISWDFGVKPKQIRKPSNVTKQTGECLSQNNVASKVERSREISRHCRIIQLSALVVSSNNLLISWQCFCLETSYYLVAPIWRKSCGLNPKSHEITQGTIPRGSKNFPEPDHEVPNGFGKNQKHFFKRF